MVVLKTKMEIYDLEYWTDLIGSLLIIFGCAFLFVGRIGLFRLRDVFERMHGASLIDTMGIGLIFIGLMFFAGFNLITLKLLIILGFVLFTSPTATHALAHAALHSGVKPNIDQSGQKLIERCLSDDQKNSGVKKSKTL